MKKLILWPFCLHLRCENVNLQKRKLSQLMPLFQLNAFIKLTSLSTNNIFQTFLQIFHLKSRISSVWSEKDQVNYWKTWGNFKKNTFTFLWHFDLVQTVSLTSKHANFSICIIKMFWQILEAPTHGQLEGTGNVHDYESCLFAICYCRNSCDLVHTAFVHCFGEQRFAQGTKGYADLWKVRWR